MREKMRSTALAALAVVALSASAEADDARYCDLYARAYIISMLPGLPPDYLTTITPEQLGVALEKNRSICLLQDEIRPVDMSDASWIEWLMARAKAAAVVPPKEMIHGVSGAPRFSPAWIEWCRKNYRTFDAATGTVIRDLGRRKSRREPCPG